MVISFKLSRRGRRFYPPPRPPPADSSKESPWEDDVLRVDDGDGIAVQRSTHDKNGTDRVELDLEPSFALNLFPDGFSIGEPGKGMLLLVIGDDPAKRPYEKAPKALFSAIEYGCLPQDILDGIPCKYLNGTIVCEVRDYRFCMSNDFSTSGADFPKVNRVALSLGIENVVKDLSSIMDGSWTYQDQLIAESMIINSLQPRLNLDPTPCLDSLCNSIVKKFDLGLHKGRFAWEPQELREMKDACLLDTSSNAFTENGKCKECSVSEGAAVCNLKTTTLECMPSRVLNCSSANHSSSPCINSTTKTVGSGPDNTVRGSSAVRDSSTFCDRNQNALRTCDADHLFQIHEQKAQVTISHADDKNRLRRRVSQRKTVVSQKRKEPSNRLCQRLKGSTPTNKTARSRAQNYLDLSQESMGTSIKGLSKSTTPKDPPMEVRIDQTINNKNMTVQQQKVLSKSRTNHPHFSLGTNSLCVQKFLDSDCSLHIRMNEGPQALFVDLDNYSTPELKNSKRSFITTCSASSAKLGSEPHENMAIIGPQPTTSKCKVSENSTICLVQQNNLKRKRQKKVAIEIEPVWQNRSSEGPATTGQASISPAMEFHVQDPIATIEPDIEKVLSEVILTTQRHGLNGKTIKVDNRKSSRSSSCCFLPPFQFFPPENAEESRYLGADMSNYLIGRNMNTSMTRRLTFLHVQNFLRGLVDESYCTLCLVESEALEDHQVVLEMILEDKHFHIATLPTSRHANKFVTQFISLMERDGYVLVNEPMHCSSSRPNGAICNNIVYNRCSGLEQFEGVSHPAYLPGEHQQYQSFSSQVAKSVVISENKDTGPAFPNMLSDAHTNLLQQDMQQHVLTQQSPTLVNMESSFLNSSCIGQLLCDIRSLQGSSFAVGLSAMDLDQFSSVWPSQVDIHHECFQRRCDMPMFNERPGMNMSTINYDQWHQLSEWLDKTVPQLDLLVSDKQSNCPVLHAGRSTGLLVSHLVGSPQMSSQTIGSDESVTSSLVELSLPFQKYLSQGT